MINQFDFDKLKKQYLNNDPFDHVVIDDFWKENIANELLYEMGETANNVRTFQMDNVTRYKSPLENKIVVPHWDLFKKTTYQAFTYLNSEFLPTIKSITNIDNLKPDVGLHAGGLHFHPRNGNLNVHKDYSIHPKLGKMRKLNIIVYMNPIWKDEWNGNLEFWSHDDEHNQPKEKIKSIKPSFNRAVIFDVSQNGWHGLPEYTKQPKDVYRQSMALYYLIEPLSNMENRAKSLFAPREDQKNDESIRQLIKDRTKITWTL